MMIEELKTPILKSAIHDPHSSFRVNQKQANKTSMRKGNTLLYWVKVVSLGLILGLGLQFA